MGVLRQITEHAASTLRRREATALPMDALRMNGLLFMMCLGAAHATGTCNSAQRYDIPASTVAASGFCPASRISVISTTIKIDALESEWTPTVMQNLKNTIIGHLTAGHDGNSLPPGYSCGRSQCVMAEGNPPSPPPARNLWPGCYAALEKYRETCTNADYPRDCTTQDVVVTSLRSTERKFMIELNVTCAACSTDATLLDMRLWTGGLYRISGLPPTTKEFIDAFGVKRQLTPELMQTPYIRYDGRPAKDEGGAFWLGALTMGMCIFAVMVCAALQLMFPATMGMQDAESLEGRREHKMKGIAVRVTAIDDDL